MRIVEKIAFIICLIIQGLYVKLRIVKLPEPPGDRSGMVGDVNHPSLRLLIIGDSAAAGVGASHQSSALSGNLVRLLSEHYHLRWRLWAKSGEKTASMLKKLQTDDQSYDYVVVSLGVNDITTPMTMNTWLNQQQSLLEVLRYNYQPDKIILGSLPPIHEFFALPNPLRYLLSRRALRFTAALKQVATDNSDVVLLDLPSLSATGTELAMASDGFHPGPSVYSAWSEAAFDVIQQHHVKASTNDLN